MDRPPSRASQDVVGSCGSRSSRPYSAQRLATPSNGMKAPGTALRSARPGTGIQSWASSSPFVPQVADRPVTQQGMAGPKTATGSGRQVADKTFYLAQLRQKRSELVEVTSQLQAELDSGSQDMAKRQQLELQVDTASKEVQHLQGQLSDLNAVLSNHISGTKLDTLHDEHAKLVASNHAERQRVDAVYANKAVKQRQTKETQKTAEQIQTQLEQKVHEMSLEQQQEYYNHQDTRQQLQATQKALEAELQGLVSQASSLETQLAAEPAKQRALALQQQVDGLSQRKAELQAEGQKPLVGPEEQRAALLAQIKADNEACELAAQKAKQATESVRQLERQGITAQPASVASSGGDRLDELQQQEQAMATFMDNFAADRTARLAELEGMQMAGSGRQLPWGRGSSDLPLLPFDESQATASQQAEMKKIQGLQEKLGAELASLSQKMTNLQTIKPDGGAVGQGKQQVSAIESQHMDTKQRLHTAQAAVREQSQLLQEERASISQQAELLAIETLEATVQRTQEANARMQQVIQSREAEANYSTTVDGVMRLVKDLNSELKQSLLL